jgi:hypothetical protein
MRPTVITRSLPWFTGLLLGSEERVDEWDHGHALAHAEITMIIATLYAVTSFAENSRLRVPMKRGPLL